MMLRVLVVSDVWLLQEGVSSVLAAQEGINIVGATDVQHARHRAAELNPDVVLFDATRPESVEHVREIVASAPGCKVVAFGVKEANDEILALAAAGTAGFVRDSTNGRDLVCVLERVMCDELLCSPRAAASLYRQVAALSRAAGAGTLPTSTQLLSKRELQIAHLIDQGLTNKQIARQLGIEATTVKNHVHNLCEKLRVHTRGEAVARIRANLRSVAHSFADTPEEEPYAAQATR